MSQKTREKKKRILASALCVMMLLFSLSAYAMTAREGSLPFTLTPNTNGYGSISLNWSNYAYQDKNFKVYKSSDGGSTYETVGIDYTLVSSVKVLNIYNPNYSGAANLKGWMQSYGKEIISVDQVTISNFNSNPNYYMKDSSGNWKYDVLFFGSNDYGFDLSATSEPVVELFIKSGRGVICGHDNMVQNFGGCAHPYFWKLASYFGISTSQSSYGYGNTKSTKVKILKKDFLQIIHMK